MLLIHLSFIMMLLNIAAVPNTETIKWPSRRLLPSYGHNDWRKMSKLEDFDPASSVNMAVKAYKKGNFGLLREMVGNVKMFEHLNQLRDNAVERQKGNVSAAFEAAVIADNANEVLAIIILTNYSVLSTFDLESALVHASVSNYQDIVDMLLKDKNLKSTIVKKKRKFLKENKDLNAALTSACEAGNILDVVSILLTSPGIDVIANHYLALKKAIVHNHHSIARLLLSRAKVKNAFDTNNQSINQSQDLNLALIDACKSGDFDIFLDIIISDRVDASKKKNSALLNGFKYGHDGMAWILLHNEKVLQSLHKTVQTVLDNYNGSYEEAYLDACTSGESEIVLALLTPRLSTEFILNGLLVAYRNHNFDTARIISRLYGQFDKNGSTNSKLESFCRSGDILGTVQILASGYVDAALDSNRALTVALVASQNEIAELLMNDKNVSDLAERIKKESLAKNSGDGVKAIVSACGSKSQNTSVVASLLLLDDSKPSSFADSALYNALQTFNIESFNILFRSVKISTYLREVFSTMLDDFKKQKDLTQEEFLNTFFKIEHLDKVFALIRHFFVDKDIDSNKYSDAFIEKGLLKMDRDIISVLTRIPELQEYIDRTISRAFKHSDTSPKTQAFEKSCENGDIIAVCSLLLTSDLIPTLKGLERAVISQNRDIVNLLLQNPIIYDAILSTKEKLILEANGDKQKAFKKAYLSENGILDTMCLTLIDDPEIDLTKNDNGPIRTAFYGQKLEIFMLLAFKEKVADPFKGIRREMLQSCQDDPKKALIQSCENGEEDEFLAIILIDVVHGNLDPSFDSNLPLKKAYRNGFHKFAQILLLFDKVQLLQISEKKELIEISGTWKHALNKATRLGRFDDVAILTVGSKVYDDLIDALILAASLNHGQIIDHLKNLIPFTNRLAAFKSHTANGQFLPVGNFQMIRRKHILSDGLLEIKYWSSFDLKRVAYLKVRFINTLGENEGSGTAFGPGPFKEFLQEIWREALKSEYQLFEGTDYGQVIISRFAKSDEETIDIFYQLGRILGKAVMRGISLDVPFADLVYRKLLRRKHEGDDLKNLDPTLFKNLLWLQNYEENVEDLGLTFSIDQVNSDSSTTRVDLIVNGSSIPVNNTNRQDYISKVFSHKMNSQSSQYQALVNGFESMINKKHSRLFSPSELKTIMYGDNKHFEISDLKPYVEFSFPGGTSTYLENTFWQVLEEFTPQERSDFLFFVTSSKRPPIGGFKYLSPKLKIEFVNNIPRTNLPRAMTCFNTLYLSTFYDQNDMKKKIKTAISLNDGFFFG